MNRIYQSLAAACTLLAALALLTPEPLLIDGAAATKRDPAIVFEGNAAANLADNAASLAGAEPMRRLPAAALGDLGG